MKDLTSFTDLLLQKLEEEGRFGTAHVYRSAVRAFTVFWREKHPEGIIPMGTAFTAATLKSFEEHLRARMLKDNTLSTYMRMLRALYNRALSCNFAPYVHGLFTHVYTGIGTEAKRALTPDDMGHLLNASALDGQATEEARIWFALMFLLRGMPFVDLARLRKCDLQGDTITYRRRKTGHPLSVKLTPAALALIHRCADPDPRSPYLLGILRSCNLPGHAAMGSREEYLRYQSALRNFNRWLKTVARRLGIRMRLSSYCARHTWATIAFHRKIAVGIISNALGHSSIKVTETYLKAFSNEELDKVNSQIINYTIRRV